MTRRLLTALVLCLLGAGLAAVLLLEHHGEGQAIVESLCGEGPASGCGAVARSPYSAIAGVPWAAIGLVFSLSLAALLGLALAAPASVRDAAAGLALALVGLALVVDLALLGVQALAVEAFCGLCLATYLVNAAALSLLWPARGALRGGGEALREASGRAVATGWVVSSLAIATAVLAGHAALASRASVRAASLLGGTLPASSPGSGSSSTPALPGAEPAPSADAETARWREQAQRLQETLDDPQKLEQYFAEKAAREFESAPVSRLDLEDVPVKGSPGAPVQVVEFSDFLCPFCRSIAGAFDAFLPQSGKRVQVYFKNYPLDQACNPSLKSSTHPGACWVALGAVCAQYQGRFWPYHDRAFATELRNPQPADVVRLAAEAGLNASALESCIHDPRTKRRLTAEIDEARGLGVQSTPTLFVNGKKLPRINDFVQVVDKEARARGFAPLALPRGN